MNLQSMADVKNQNRANCGKDQTGWMKAFVCRARKDVGNGPTEDGSDDAEHNRPEKRHVRVHHRLRQNSCDQTNENIPDDMEHNFESDSCGARRLTAFS